MPMHFSSKVKIEVKTTEPTQCGPLIITKPRFFQPKLFSPTHMSTSITIIIVVFYVIFFLRNSTNVKTHDFVKLYLSILYKTKLISKCSTS